MKNHTSYITLIALCCFALSGANAQMFDDEVSDTLTATEKVETKPLSSKPQNGFVPPEKLLKQNNDSATKTQEPGKINVKSDEIKVDTTPKKTVNQAKQPNLNQNPTQTEPKKPLTSDVKQYKIVNGKRVEDEEKEAIYIFYKDFKMVRNVGQTACDVRFVLVTKLADKLSSISMRLVWPGLATKLTYDNVQPGVENYYDYRFYGDGCYSLDKLPNITVNRCRLKNKSQRECASLLRLMRWVED